MPSYEIRPATPNDLPRLMAMDHSCLSDYVWQLELRRDTGQISSSFREVRLPRSVVVTYPRDPMSLTQEWTHRDGILVALVESIPSGYTAVVEERSSTAARITDIVVSRERRRQGVGSALLTAVQTWALERGLHRLILEMQSKNQPYIRLAQKFGYEFCGYNDQYYPTQDVALFFGRALK
ncbi:MAG TPA: GNAT family N-acetyltransferase [Anaerolineales bacterium]|nr:GNAT family N-acetyltransferase [Anaerolineales bacterium]